MIVMQPLQQQAQQQGGQHGAPQPPNAMNPQQQQGYAPPPLPPPPPSGQDWTLSSVLHYLQSEWRKYERDRNEWEIERAEMRARIALLEGERRSFENVKLDFMRRIKMLEYALRVERSKQLTAPHPGSGGPSRGHMKGNLSKEEAGADHKSGSGSSSPRSEDMPLDARHTGDSLPMLPNGAPPGPIPSSTSQVPSGRPPSWPAGPSANSVYVQGSNPNIGLGRPPMGRDPKSRARSREYLKQCLQEITYLTSPQAVNPLPNRPLLNIAGSSSAPNLVSIPNLPTFSVDFAPAQSALQQPPNQPSASISQPQAPQQPPQSASQPQAHLQNPQTPGTIQLTATNGRPRKLVPDVGRDALMSNATADTPSESDHNVRTVAIAPDTPADISHLGEHERDEDENEEINAVTAEHSEPRLASPPRLSLLHPEPQSDANISIDTSSSNATSEGPGTSREPTQLTAIFRPDDAGQWREQLRAAHVNANESPNDQDHDPSVSSDMLSLVSKELLDEDDTDLAGGMESLAGDEAPAGPAWKPKRTLRSHLDAVRTISFHPNELSLATGGDDNTIKLWRVDPAGLTSTAARPSTDLEPQLTLRAHTAAISSIIHSPSRRLLYSASLDSTIRVWILPHPNRTTYAPFEANVGLAYATLVGHTDAVWDLALVRNETTLVSCGAEGSIKVWDVSGNEPGGKLKLSWGYSGTDSESHGDGPGTTSLEAVKTDLRTIAVAFRDAIVKLFDLETGKETGRLNSDMSFDGTSRTQINKIVSHPTIPLIVTAHEDRYIRIFDILTGQCTHSMLAHLDSVTSLSIDPSGFTLVSSGQDCSIRFWDLLNTRACIQESTVHRKKGDEGVLDVTFHPGGLPFLASAGADGAVKLYAS